MKKVYFWVCVLLFILADISFSILSIAFYNPYSRFDIKVLISKIWSRYDFTSSPREFIGLSFVRILICIVMFICLRLRRITIRQWYLISLIVQLCNLSISFAKILAFSEHADQKYWPSQLTYIGVWMSLLWNVSAFLILHFLWKFGLINGMFDPAQRNDDLEYQRLRDEPKKEETVSIWAHMIQLLKFCSYYWRRLAVGFILLIVHSLASIFIPLQTAKAISLIASHDVKAFNETVMYVIYLNIASIVSGGTRKGILNYVSGLINNRIRKELFASLTKQEIAFFHEEDAHTGNLISRLVADCAQMSNTVTNNLDNFLADVCMVAFSIGIMISLSWRLTLVTFAGMPILALLVTLVSPYIAIFSKKTQETMADANQVAMEVISSMSTVRSFACERKECTRFEQNLEETRSFYKKTAIALGLNQMLSELATSAVLITVLCYGGYLARSDRIHIDEMIAFWLYQLQLIPKLLSINAAFSGLMQSVGASRKIFEYVNRDPKIKYEDPEQTTETPARDKPIRDIPIRGKVEFKNVHFSYSNRPNFLLQDISFCAEPGETIALVGPTGAGKSSIISLLNRFYESNEGQILLDNTPISEFGHTYFHKKVALVAQQPVLYARSVRDNILYGCDKTISDEDMIQAAKLANIHDFIMEMEDKYETNCGENGVQMSGGQKQRIAIARAIVRKPVVLILDEATSALDAESEHIIQEALAKCSAGRTTIVSAHRLSTVKKAHKILVIENGMITQCGSHKELMRQRNGLYYKLVQRQQIGSMAGTSSQ